MIILEVNSILQVEEQEIKRKEKELVATVRLPAESESYRVETIAFGRRTQVTILINLINTTSFHTYNLHIIVGNN